MLTIDKYLRPQTLEDAYEAAQKKNSAVLGGMLWLRLGNRRIGTAIDLSGLGLEQIEDCGDVWRIGAYTSLRTLETHPALESFSGGAVRASLSSIVGVQFRNLATVGGSVFGRFGFSDVITTLLALDASVVLYKAGTISLEQFCTVGKTGDILTHVLLPKDPVSMSYQAHRNSAADFPVLNVCAVRKEDRLTVTVGARPLRAVPYRFQADDTIPPEVLAEQIAGQTVAETEFASNSRASAAYRSHLCGVLVRRAVLYAMTGKEGK
ncbi:MAG: FAD binding domain-containing protein [Clostridia bacterium]|nr:FAD binding domain-containing protein [Clostridia bacterium]